MIKNKKAQQNTPARFNQGIADSKGIVLVEAVTINEPEPSINYS